MLSPNLNDLFVLICLAAITAIPFYFRTWLHRVKPVLADEVQRKTSQLSTLIFIALFAGAFLYPVHSGKVAQVLLVAAILSFSFLYQTAGRYSHTQNKTREQTPRSSLRQQGARLVIGFVICGLIALHPLHIFWVLLSLPFIGPSFIRLQYRCHKMEDSALKASISALFKKAKAPLSEIFLIDEPSSQMKNALVSGSRFGKGIAGRTLFITLNMFETLSEIELTAVLLHEATHLQLNHISKRVFSSVGYMVLAVLLITVPISLIFHSNAVAIAISGAVAFFLQAYWMKRVIHRQEMEADLGSVELGSKPEALISALEKLTPPHSPSRSISSGAGFGSAYPTLQERSLALKEYSAKISHLEEVENIRCA